ncbi:hypothetical protein C8R43DRAFT_885859, partial [Mycena crocata]
MPGLSPKDVPKVSTALPELAEAKVAAWKSQVDDDDELPGDPENHRGRVKIRELQRSLRDKIFECKDAGSFWRVLRGWTDPRPKPVQVSLEELTEEFKKRMNEPEEIPASFNKERLDMSARLFEEMPRSNEDHSPKKTFSRKLTLEDIEWGKRHIMTNLSTSTGIDDFSYGDIMEIPNDKLRDLLQAIIDKKIFPSKCYRLIVLECCLLKFLTLLIDRRVKEFSKDAKLIPETQNGFMATYRTNNNPFLLRVMADRSAAEGKVLYVAVVDLKNAFPAVNRNVLFLTLNSMGVAGDLID